MCVAGVFFVNPLTKLFHMDTISMKYFQAIIICYLFIGATATLSMADVLVGFSTATAAQGESVNMLIGHQGTYAEPVDVYVAYRVPGDSRAFYWPNHTLEPLPWIQNWLPTEVALTSFFTVGFLETHPLGEYVLYAGMVKSGTYSSALDTLVGPVAVASLTLGASSDLYSGPVVSLSPANNSTVASPPRFEIVFSSAVNQDLLIENSTVVVESVASQKQMTYYTSPSSEQWVDLYIPDDGHRINADEASLLQVESLQNDTGLGLTLLPMTFQGQTFSLSSGATYTFMVTFSDQATLLDGTSLAGTVLGPIIRIVWLASLLQNY